LKRADFFAPDYLDCICYKINKHMHIHIGIDEIRAILPDASQVGDATPDITFVASLEEATPCDAAFCQGHQNSTKLAQTKAGVVFVPQDTTQLPGEGQVFFIVKDPSMALAKLCEIIDRAMHPAPAAGVHPNAFVDSQAIVAASASIGPMCTVGPGSVIEEGVILEAHVSIGREVRIGANSHFYPGVVVGDYCKIGKSVRLHPGVVIGGDGFGYMQVGKLPDIVHYKVPQIGNVVIEDEVEIGANSTVDRARFGSTIIGEGTKIDNFVQIAHNVKIGRGCIFCSQSGVAGSTTVGDYVLVWGQAAIVGHIEVGSFSVIGGQAGVTKSLPQGSKVTGTPARSMYEVRKADATLAKLTPLMPKLRKLLNENATD
jgi:UDP-3-O-[3-hydroxymyristoyl] glucosamine N-acyltransferase